MFVALIKNYTLAVGAVMVGDFSKKHFLVNPSWPDVHDHILDYNLNGVFDVCVQIGSKSKIEYYIRVHAEAYHELRNSSGG